MSPDEALDKALGRAATVAYLLLVLFMISAFVPGLRRRAWQWLQWQMWLWEMGNWEARFAELPAWKKEALEVRGRRILRKVQQT